MLSNNTSTILLILNFVLYFIILIDQINADKYDKKAKDEWKKFIKESGCGRPKTKSTIKARIHGGDYVTDFGLYPWMVSVYDFDVELRCSGTLVGPRHVLTAAHCVHRTKWVHNVTRVLMGDVNHDVMLRNEPKYRYEVFKNPLVHHDYHKMNRKNGGYRYVNDIALITLKRDITPVSNMIPVCLYSNRMKPLQFESKKKAIIGGWGATRKNEGPSSRLRADSKIYIYSHDDCKDSMKDLRDEEMCIGDINHSACPGDSGGQVIVRDENGDRFYQVAVISSRMGECGEFKGPFFGQKVRSYYDWISDKIVKTLAEFYREKECKQCMRHIFV